MNKKTRYERALKKKFRNEKIQGIIHGTTSLEIAEDKVSEKRIFVAVGNIKDLKKPSFWQKLKGFLGK